MCRGRCESQVSAELADSVVNAMIWRFKEAKYLFFDASAGFSISIWICSVCVFRCCGRGEYSDRMFDDRAPVGTRQLDYASG